MEFSEAWAEAEKRREETDKWRRAHLGQSLPEGMFPWWAMQREGWPFERTVFKVQDGQGKFERRCRGSAPPEGDGLPVDEWESVSDEDMAAEDWVVIGTGYD